MQQARVYHLLAFAPDWHPTEVRSTQLPAGASGPLEEGREACEFAVQHASGQNLLEIADTLLQRRWDGVLVSGEGWKGFGTRGLYVLELLAQALADGRIRSVVMLAFPEEINAPHVAAIARRLPVGLFVVDHDGPVALARLIRAAPAVREASSRLSARRPERKSYQRALANLPTSWRSALHRARESPGDWPVKRVLRECGTTRRTLERRLKALGLPSPAVLLRTIAHHNANRPDDPGAE